MKDIKTRPVVGWKISGVAETAILLSLETVSSDAQLRAVMAERAAPDTLPALMTPPQALELAAALQRAAHRILEQQTPDKSRQS